ncbi:nuclear transport factor 2 family protein [Devosia sp.]|uniref:nuclear transport factor 2 family protein n=1 Tax=Devosia sp. TaxID=1871048 RepID=UPI003A8E6080
MARLARPAPGAEVQLVGDKAAARAVAAARAQFNAALAARDMAVIAETLSDAVTLVPGDDAVLITGREAQLEAWQSIFTNMPDVSYVRAPARIEIGEDGELAGETGRWRGAWSSEGFSIRYSGRYFAKWRFDGVRWTIEAEIFVTLKRQG